MTYEETQILIKDICARLPYGVRVKQGGWEHTLKSANMYSVSFDSSCAIPIPLLRPMSNMTEEEREEFRIIGGVMSHNPQNDSWAISAFTPEAYDWLLAHHFDFRGLIEKGLAIEATEGMYKV